ncbi:type VI secretion system protein TssA [Thalassoroseus pseudoceratinae]|uniref:type VI secretion system protein TssA n=1 Tax=Thalassoroseus pseudoceratinae TaxID=2713176 RepID=UPI001422840A|nr:type VI secretion system protein TssA [Thalassoroseus pseudoceratinae]
MSPWIDELTPLKNPISQSDPSGPNLEYDEQFGDMERAAYGRKEQEFGDTLIEAEAPDWKSLRSLSLELCQRTHDLRVGVRLAESLVNLEGLHPLPAALDLLADWIETEWDTLHPTLDPDDDNDPTIRINAFADLTHPERMLTTIETAPLVEAVGHRPVCLRELISSQSSEASSTDARSAAEIDAVFLACDRDELQTMQQTARESLASLDRLEDRLAQRVGSVSTPEFGPLRRMLQRIESSLIEFDGKRGPVANADCESNNEDCTAESPASASEHNVPQAPKHIASPATISSRQEVVTALRRICEYYQRHEPSSPVPLLLQRAERLATMSFFDILQDMASAGLPQAEEVCGTRSHSE